MPMMLKTERNQEFAQQPCTRLEHERVDSVTDLSSLVKEEGVYVIKADEMDGLAVKQELDIGLTVLQPKILSGSILPLSQQVNAPGPHHNTSSNDCAVPASLDTTLTQPCSRIKVEDDRCEENSTVTSDGSLMSNIKTDNGYKRKVPYDCSDSEDTSMGSTKTAFNPFGCCTTDFLLNDKNSFSKLTFPQKRTLIQFGRAKPAMKIIYKRRDGFSKHFHGSNYEKYPWLTGSCKLNRMFCFPCLLFEKSKNVWNNHGYADMNNVTNSAKKHMRTEKHIKSCLDLHEFADDKVKNSPTDQNYDSYNKKVEHNRNLMKRFVDTVILLVQQRISFRYCDQNALSGIRDNYEETLLYLKRYDAALDVYWEQCSLSGNTIFNGISSDIVGDLTSCIAEVVRNDIKTQIGVAEFVSVVADVTRDTTHKEQTSITIRYLTTTGIEERFVGFFEIGNSAGELAHCVLQVLDRYRCKDKLIGQSYDSAAVILGEGGGVQTIVSSQCPMAVFVPCYAHALNLLLMRSLENIPELKQFFGHVDCIIRFFNDSARRSGLLKSTSPAPAETQWCYHSRIVNVIFNSRSDMIGAFNIIIDNPREWDPESIAMSEFLLNKLEDREFCFILYILSEIFAETGASLALYRKERIDINSVIREVESLLSWFDTDFVNKFDLIYNTVSGAREPSRRRRRLNANFDVRPEYKRLFTVIIENVRSQIETRFVSMKRKRCYMHSMFVWLFCGQTPDGGIGVVLCRSVSMYAAVASYLIVVSEFLAAYGWYVVGGVVAFLYAASYLKPVLNKWQQAREDAAYHKDPDRVAARLEAERRARELQQQQLAAASARALELQKEREERKRLEAVERLERYSSPAGSGHRLGSTNDDFLPLSHGAEGGSSYRPPKRSACSRGGCGR